MLKGRCVLWAVMAAALWTSAAASAGDLEPPPGPPDSTMKPLSLIEPRIPVNPDLSALAGYTIYIGQPGSYYLTGDVVGTPLSNGIGILSDDVTLDLNGFTLRGIPASLNGIRALGKNIVIRNGTVRDFPGAGVEVASLEDIRVVNCGRGITIGIGQTAVRCTVSECEYGISAGNGSILDSCRVIDSYGIFASGAVIRDCTVTNSPIHGFVVYSGSLLSGCIALNCAANGFVANSSSTLARCTSRANGQHGFELLGASTATNCTASENTANGFVIMEQSTANECIATSNRQNGMVLVRGAAIGCSAMLNSPIELDGAGFTLTEYHCRVERCYATSNYGVGFRIRGYGHAVFSNTAANNNTDYDIQGTNLLVGPIVGTASIATNTNPQANFELDD